MCGMWEWSTMQATQAPFLLYSHQCLKASEETSATGPERGAVYPPSSGGYPDMEDDEEGDLCEDGGSGTGTM